MRTLAAITGTVLAFSTCGEPKTAAVPYNDIARLHWHTDLSEAKAEALETGRPILSLRMLGKLTDELSCANSRFFRTTLYVHPEVSRILRQEFVLHWSSERPVPVITIDMGDGRALKRTVTGNSIHYVLDHDGRVVDAIPGLYGPQAFIAKLEAGLERSAQKEQVGGRPLAIRNRRVPAIDAIPIAASKAMVEAPMVGGETAIDPIRYEAPVLAEVTKEIMRRENPQLGAAQIEAMIDRFTQSLARDAITNEMLYSRIRRELDASPRPKMEELNRWVYAELFKTPATDPWLGLHDDAIYTALDGAGITYR